MSPDLSTKALEVEEFDKELPDLEQDAFTVIASWKVVRSEIRFRKPNLLIGSAGMSGAWKNQGIFHFDFTKSAVSNMVWISAGVEELHLARAKASYVPSMTTTNSPHVVEGVM